MTGGDDSRKRFIDRLGFRLGVVLSMALLPVGLLAVLQARSLMNEARARSEAALAGETLRVILPELRLIRQGQGVSEALAAVVPILLSQADGPGDCDRAMRRTVNVSGVYAYAAFVTVDGTLACASDRNLDLPVKRADIAGLRPPGNITLISANGAEGGSPSGLAAVHPVTGRDGALLGYTLVNMPHSRLSAAAATMTPRKKNFALILFDDEGRILSANRDGGDPTALLPRDRSLVSLTADQSQTFTAPDTSGVTRSFSVTKLADVNMFALGSWPASAGSPSFARSIPAVVFPFLMWAACLVAAWLAAETMVTAYIRSLRRAIRSFSGGNRVVIRLDMARAPLEIREVSDTFQQMTETILRDEAKLENSLRQKEVLLREVNHRVKNNLQLIASIMNMQMRKTTSAEAKFLMKGLQERVMSLATVHKGLYQTSGLTDIRADELFPEIVNQVIRMASGPGRQFHVKTRFDDLHLTPDQAVPLALLLTEAITNAVKYAAPAEDAAVAELFVGLRRTAGEEAQLVIENSLGGQAGIGGDAAAGSGLGTQLIDAFARQLNGTLERRADGGTYRLGLTFPLRLPVEDEAGQRDDSVNSTAE